MTIRFLKITGLFIFLLNPAFAQNSSLTGTVTDDVHQPIAGAAVTIKKINTTVTTDSTGKFIFDKLVPGDYELEIKRSDFSTYTESVHHENVNQEVQIVTSGITTTMMNAVTDNMPTVSLGEDEIKDNSGNAVASLLSSSRDPFVAAATYNFSMARFRIRGYDDDNFITLMNGLPLADLSNGRTLFNTWSGLNDVIRNRENSIGLSPASYSFGGIGGAYYIDSRASRQRKQLQVTYSASNRTYDNRLMVTWGSGLLANGWSVAISFSRRWAQEGFVKGTFYDGNSIYGSVEKIINANHSLSLTLLGSVTKNARSGPATQEMFDLAGTHYYNPYWGYQNGVVRSAAVAKSVSPVIILQHDWKIDDISNLRTSVGLNSGSYSVSGLDWYKAADPRPDYYRNLPSYDPFYGEDSASYAFYSNQIRSNLVNNEAARQIQWDRLYEANRMNDTVFHGTRGTWAKYILSDRVIDSKRFFFNTAYSKIVNDHVTLHAGLMYESQTNDYYRVVNDLLGADFFVNLNQFGDMNNPGDTNLVQNDLNNPNRILHAGDRYGYDYTSHITKSMLWAQGIFKYDRFDYFVGVNVGTNFFQRDGHVRSGVFANDSYGKSVRQEFTYQGIKAGTTYKYNGRSYFLLNGMYQTRAPYFENAFVSPNTRNLVVNNLKLETIYSLEGGYMYKAPRLKAKVMGYLTQFENGTDTRRFYHEEYNTFVNYSLTGIDKRHAGIELGVDANLGSGFSAVAVASLGNFIYTSRPMGTATQDNKDTVLISNETIYMKNIHVASGPQHAYTVGLYYRSPKFWFLNVNLNYFDHIYTDINPARRTLQALDLVDAGTQKWVDILSQERLKGQFTLDASAGWSYRLNNKFKDFKRPTFINFNLGLTNILNNQNLNTTAFEQLRFDFTDNNVQKFPAKYMYAYGTTFFLNIVFRMN